jgi:hypothetical protein
MASLIAETSGSEWKGAGAHNSAAPGLTAHGLVDRPGFFGLPLGDSFLVCNRDFHRSAFHTCWHARDATLDGSVKLSAPTCESRAGYVFWLPSVHFEFDFDRVALIFIEISKPVLGKTTTFA